MTYSIPYSSWSTPPQTGDEIAALGEKNQLVGKTIFNGGFTALTIYGDDFYTPGVIENLSDGESYTFEVWNPVSKKTTNHKFTNWERGDGKYTTNEIAVAGMDSNEPIELYFEMEIYPNPNSGHFAIDIISTEGIEVILEIYDNMGKQVYQTELKVNEGKQNYRLNLISLEIGTYTLALIRKGIDKQAKLVIVK